MSVDNLQSIAFQLPELAILSLGMMVTILSGGINLSVVANANLCGIVTIIVFTSLSRSVGPELGSGMTTVISLIVGAACALIVGMVNGYLVGTVGVSAILATLGTMTLVGGVNVLATRGHSVSGVPSSVVYLGNGTVLAVPIPLFILVGCGFFLAFILNRTALGYRILMLGSNPEATRYGGVNNRRVLLQTYMLSSFFAICASFVMMGRFNSTGADYGNSYVLLTILACVLGGVDPAGGFGKVLGLFLAIAVLGVIETGLNLVWSSPDLALVTWGVILIIYMAIRHGITYLSTTRHIERKHPVNNQLSSDDLGVGGEREP